MLNHARDKSYILETIIVHSVVKESRRRDRRRTHPKLAVRFDGRIYDTLDWSLGGFSIANYAGKRQPDDQFFVELWSTVGGEMLRTLMTAVVVRSNSRHGVFAAKFVRFHGESFSKLEQIAMQRLRR